MNRLNNKRIILGITGGIAAYKSADLVRRFKEQGSDVRVVMTTAAQKFITPLTMQALSGHPTHVSLLDTEAEAAMGHIELARWADIIVIAPASADFAAKLSHGQGDDPLATLCLAARCPIAIAPAMNQAMWQTPANQTNIDTLSRRHIHIFGPGEGAQACGDTGPGRMLEPDEIARETANLFDTGLLSGKKIVVTAGPTREVIDPVRYISNHSSGKMGFALAEAACEAGASIVLISGPVNLETPERTKRIDVVSARDMLEATLKAIEGADIFIATAAVADYRPATTADHKIKKNGDGLTLSLVENPDIIATVARQPNAPFTVGFAAETKNLMAHAQEKIKRKQLDMIIANDVSQQGIGFNSDNNAVTVVTTHSHKELPTAPKRKIARQLIREISEQFNKKQ